MRGTESQQALSKAKQAEVASKSSESLVRDFARPALRKRLMVLVLPGEAKCMHDRVEEAMAASLRCSVEAFQALLCSHAIAGLAPKVNHLELCAGVSCPVLRLLCGR